MIDKIMQRAESQTEYIDLLPVLRRDVSMDGATVHRLVELYLKYGEGVESGGDAQIWIAVDMLPGRDRCNIGDFAEIGLAEQSLDALFTAREILLRSSGVNEAGAQKILDQVNDSAADIKIRVTLARIALDAMAAARNFNELLDQISGLATFLGEHSEEMEKCAAFVKELRDKCRGESHE